MFKKIFFIGVMMSAMALAERGPGGPGRPGGHGGGFGGGGGGAVVSITGDLDAVIADIDAQIDYLPPQIQGLAAEMLKASDARLHAVMARLDSACGKWIQTNSVDCTTVCRGLGLNNVPSPEGALCVSGEARVNSANGKIVYNNGTWGSGCTAGVCPTVSVGAFCYLPGQKRDNDRTDRTVGCFCKR